eukprot:TRINITY_DN3725_c0_g1_i1.p1 TRINITY_DN3725_c0_g1~~TRINITY_DN3725_c0_g1_i1.p1  ORF type:complete len:320 (-),score=70.02 TRINITY_DN3725_c0_g1_i1:16-975(-)
MITRNMNQGGFTSSLLYICLFLVWIQATTQIVSLPRLNVETKYHVVYISGIPPEGSQTIPMVSPTNGEKFDCVLPETDTMNESATKTQKAKVKRKSPSELLQSMTTCLYRLTGWWTYEFCRGSHVRQFHQEEKTVVSQFYLGSTFSGSVNDENDNDEDDDDDDDDEDENIDIGLDELDENGKEGLDPATGKPTNYKTLVVENTGEDEPQKQEEHEVPPSSEAVSKKKKEKDDDASLTKFYTEMYIDGTTCDLTNQPRTIEVQYFCTEGDKSFISEISEPSTCNYQLFVATPLLCRHPDYNSQSERVYPIECYSMPKEEI